MISQGYSLWAIGPDGTPYAVVGWSWRGEGGISYPVMCPLEPSGPSRGAVASGPDDLELFTFTTTDPSTSASDHVRDLRAALNEANRNLATFRQAMDVLADTLDTGGDVAARSVSAMIRQELDR